MKITEFLKSPDFHHRFIVFCRKSKFFDDKLESGFLNDEEYKSIDEMRRKITPEKTEIFNRCKDMLFNLGDHKKAILHISNGKKINDKDLAISQIEEIYDDNGLERVLIFVEANWKEVKSWCGAKPDILVLDEETPTKSNLMNFMDVYFPETTPEFKQQMVEHNKLLGNDFWGVYTRVESLHNSDGTMNYDNAAHILNGTFGKQVAGSKIKAPLLDFIKDSNNKNLLFVISILDSLHYEDKKSNLIMLFTKAVRDIMRMSNLTAYKGKLLFLSAKTLVLDNTMPNKKFIREIHQVLLYMIDK